MSMGYGGWCQFIEDDGKSILYQYGAYNLNEPKFRNKERLQDGMIFIQKKALVEPEIRKKWKRIPQGRKKEVIKRLAVPVPYEELYGQGLIQIQDCSHCWRTSIGGKDFMAWHLVNKVFSHYQEHGTLPEVASYDV